MSGEEPVEGASSNSVSSGSESTKLTQEEALQRLEDHRCAICSKILINASRIDCGHTFCRYCLNIHCESRNDRGKPTCFICDAAVTEISQNADRDKEIDALYSALPVDKQLRRAREKAERKSEEESLANRPKVDRLRDIHIRHSAQTTNEAESFAGGDPSGYGYDENAAAGASWTEHGPLVYDIHGHDDHDAPTCYCTDCQSHSHAYWSEDTDSSHYNQQEFDFPSSNEEEDELNNESDSISSPDCPHSSFHQPQPPPIVIHHTVQHVFHTVHVRQETRRDDFGNNDVIPQRNDPFDWNRGHEQSYGLPRSSYISRDHHPACVQQMSFPNYNCHYGNHPTGLIFPVPHRDCFTNHNPYSYQSSYTGNAYGNHRPMTFSYIGEPDFVHRCDCDRSQNVYSSFQEERERELYEAGLNDSHEGPPDPDRSSPRENLCDFHQAMLEQEQRDLREVSRSLAALNLGRPDSNDGIDRNSMENNQSSDDNERSLHVMMPAPRSESFDNVRRGRRFRRSVSRAPRDRHSEFEDLPPTES